MAWLDQHLAGACDAGPASDQTSALQGEHHLVDRRRADAEVALQVGFGGRAAEHDGQAHRAAQVRTVMDNLSTHFAGALHEVFPAPEAHCVLRHLEFRYTPKCASLSQGFCHSEAD